MSELGPFCDCVYACATDEDCATGMVCGPPELSENATYPRCVPAACKDGDDCASGECGLVDYFDGCGVVTELRCRDSKQDTCRGDGDCAEAGIAFTSDVAAGGAAFACVLVGCEAGQPHCPSTKRCWRSTSGA